MPTLCLLPRAAEAPRKIFVASGGMSGRQDNFNASVGIGMGEDSSSCSCLFGCAPRPSWHTTRAKGALRCRCGDTPPPLCLPRQEPVRLTVQLQGLAQPQRSRKKERLEGLQLTEHAQAGRHTIGAGVRGRARALLSHHDTASHRHGGAEAVP